jgi:hypothetical protein
VPSLEEVPCPPRHAVAGGGAAPPASRSCQKGTCPMLWKWRGREREGEGEGGQSGEGEGGRSGETERGALGLGLRKGEAARWEREACGETERVREESRNPKGSVFILESVLRFCSVNRGLEPNYPALFRFLRTGNRTRNQNFWFLLIRFRFRLIRFGSRFSVIFALS